MLCDVGGVLTPPPVLAAAEYLTGRGVSLKELARAIAEDAGRRGHNPLVELELGQVTERAFLEMIGEAIQRHLRHEADVRDFSDHYFATVELNEALLEHLSSLRDAGARLALLSNNAREWHDRWLAMPELEIFEDFVNSAIVGIRKPDHAIYRLAAERLGVRPRQCAFLDDLEVNCEAARAVGMSAIHFIDTATAIAALDGLVVSGAPEP